MHTMFFTITISLESSTFTASILKVMYDIDVTDLDDEYVLLAQTALEGLSITTVPGRFWVELFPFIRYLPSWFPWTYSRRTAEHYKPAVEALRDKPFDAIKIDMVRFTYLIIWYLLIGFS